MSSDIRKINGKQNLNADYNKKQNSKVSSLISSLHKMNCNTFLEEIKVLKQVMKDEYFD